MFSPIRTQDL
jgi:hypothetical protein